MGKIAIISDIHSNTLALRTVLRDIEKKGVNDIYCLGDIVPKYTDPKEAIDMIKSNCKIVVKGNGEQNVVNNPSYTYTRNKLTIDDLDYLDNLPIAYDMNISGKLLRMFHASPYGYEFMYNPHFSNEDTYYKDKTHDTHHSMFDNTLFIGKEDIITTPDIIAFGHTHLPLVQRLHDNRMIINPGSVGDPGLIVDNRILIGSDLSYIIVEGHLDSLEDLPYQVTVVEIPYIDLLKEVRHSVITSGMATTPSLIKRIDESLEHTGRGK